MEENFETFMEFCGEYLHSAVNKFIGHVKKRFDECDEEYKDSNECLDNILDTKGKIRSDSLRYFPHLRDFVNVLKDNKKAESRSRNESDERSRSNYKRSSNISPDEDDLRNVSKRRETDQYTQNVLRGKLQENFNEQSIHDGCIPGDKSGEFASTADDAVPEGKQRHGKDNIFHIKGRKGNESKAFENTTFQNISKSDSTKEVNKGQNENNKAKTKVGPNSLEICKPTDNLQNINTFAESLGLKRIEWNSLKPDEGLPDGAKSEKLFDNRQSFDQTFNHKNKCNSRNGDGSYDSQSFLECHQSVMGPSMSNTPKLKRKIKRKKKSSANKKPIVSIITDSESESEFVPRKINKRRLNKTPVTIVTDSESESDVINKEVNKKKFKGKIKFKMGKQVWIKEYSLFQEENNHDKFEQAVAANSAEPNKEISSKNEHTNNTSPDISLGNFPEVLSNVGNIPKESKNKTVKIAKKRRRKLRNDTTLFRQSEKCKIRRNILKATAPCGKIKRDGKYDTRIRRLTSVFENILNKIEKMEMRDTEMEQKKNEITHFVHKYLLYRKYMEVWNELCQLHRASGSTRRSAEEMLKEKGTKSPDVTPMIEYFRIRATFPVRKDLQDIVERVNTHRRLHLSKEEVDNLSSEIFTDVANQLHLHRTSNADFAAQPDVLPASDEGTR